MNGDDRMIRSIVTFAILICLEFPGIAMGQWSPDSLQNLAICDLAGEQVTPKIVPTSDGGCFVSWFDSRDGGYAMYLQRLDALGVPLLPAGGLLISDHPQQSWLVDYDMAVDGNDNAVLVFSDTRYADGELDVSAYMIGSDGTFRWGSDGICLSDTTKTGFEPAPKVAVTGSGNCIFTWGWSDEEYLLVFQKVSPTGEKLWGDWGISFGSGTGDLSSPDVVPTGEDGAIVLWKSSTGSFPSQTTWLYTGLLDMDGGWGWDDTPILIYNSGDISPWTFPEIEPDGIGGALFFWYDALDLSTFNVWVQHVDAEGNLRFPMNGAQASTNSDNRLHMSPSAVYLPAGDKTYVFWVEENDNQDQYGLYAQLFSPVGARLWTDSGLELVPITGNQISFVKALSDGDGIYVGYFIGSLDTAVRALRVGYDGTMAWGPVTLSAASLGGKDDLVVCPGADLSALFTWCDNRNDYGIYAQNVHQDGSIGPATGIGEAAPQVGPAALSAFPNPSTAGVSVHFSLESGGTVTLEVYDLSGRRVRTLSEGVLSAGEHSVSWDRGSGSGPSLEPGVYLVRLTTGSGVNVARMVLL
jgi:hypothetical protein